MPDENTIQELAARLHGQLLRPTDAGYDEARKLYNAMIDRHPALIARCADEADVVACVNLARELGLPLGVRGGGHNGPGLALVDDGLVADLSGMDALAVDPAERTVRVGPGCTWGDVDRACGEHRLATVSGIISTTGVPGLTLGGGHGYLTRKYGLTVDNLLEAEVVLADGQVVTANADDHPDLFWALRGGGGNFGVVTSFLFRLHKVGEVLAGPSVWSMDDAEAVLRRYRDLLPTADENLSGFFAFMTVPPAPPFPESLHGQKVCAIMWCWLGKPEELDGALAPLRDAIAPVFEHIGPIGYPALQGMFDALYPPGLRWYWKGDFIRTLPDEAIALHVAHAREMPTPLSAVHLFPIDGAVHRVAPDATAFGYRDCHWSSVIVGVGERLEDDDVIRDWTRNYWQALHPYSAGGAYVNFMEDEGEERVRAAYRGNYDRLAAVKSRYDPANLFRHNQNIRPAPV